MSSVKVDRMRNVNSIGIIMVRTVSQCFRYLPPLYAGWLFLPLGNSRLFPRFARIAGFLFYGPLIANYCGALCCVCDYIAMP